MRPQAERWLFLMEYLLLGFVPLADLPSISDPIIPVRPILTISCVAALALVGLWRPKTEQQKWMLVTTQALLVTVATFLAFDRLFRWLYLVPVTRACAIFNLRGRVIASSACLMLCSAGIYQREILLRHTHAHSILGTFVFMLSQILSMWLLYGLVVILATVMFAERQHREELERLNVELKVSRERLAQLQLQEQRLRIARDLHDAVGNSLTALNIQLENVQKRLQNDPQGAEPFLTGARQLGQEAISDLRRSVAQLREYIDGSLTLKEGLLALLDSIRNGGDLRLRLRYELQADPEDHVKMSIYRIVQEALTNVRKHARASQASVTLGQSSDGILLLVHDDGVGIAETGSDQGFGMRGMHERVLNCGGTLAIKSGAGMGTLIRAQFPAKKTLMS
jgi:signal transduction histidine kinase